MNVGAATQLPPTQLLNRNAACLAKVTARRSVVLEAVCPSFRTIAGSRPSLRRRTLVPGTSLAATPTRRRSVAFPALFRWLRTVAAPMPPSQTACRRAKPEASRTAALSTTRSATAATLLLRLVSRVARTRCLLAAITPVRETAARAVVAQPVSLCTVPTWPKEVAIDWQDPGKQNKGLRRSFASDTPLP